MFIKNCLVNPVVVKDIHFKREKNEDKEDTYTANIFYKENERTAKKGEPDISIEGLTGSEVQVLTAKFEKYYGVRLQ